MNSSVDAIRRGLLCAMATALPAWAQEAGGSNGPAELGGRWRTLATSKGGVGSMLQFREGGVLEVSPGAVVEMTYRLEGDTLILPPATLSGPEQRETITWLGDNRIRLRSAVDADPGQEFARARRREPSTDRLLGEWVGSREMGGRTVKVLRFFYAGGKGLLLIPFLSQIGHYSVTNTRLLLEIPGRPPRDSGFAILGEVLTLTSADGQETKYERY